MASASILGLEPSRPSLTQVENAFQPAKEVTAPEKFAGRRDSVQQSYYGLLSEGADLAIVGNRGIGKTSLGRQIINLATGDNDLLEKLSLSHDRRLDFMSIYLSCGSTVQDTTVLLERLLSSRSCLAEWIYDIPSASKAASGYTPKVGGNLLGVELGISYEKKTEQAYDSALSAHSIDAVFTNVVDAITKQNLAADGLLIVIDEFDQIGDPSGFASFLKAIATNVPKVKFCIVGVAQDIQNLMKEHQSSDRLFAGAIVALPSMNSQELKEIIFIAEQSVGGYFRFSEDAADRLVELAHGHPYMVHLIGKYTLRHAFQDDVRHISAAMIDRTMALIAERQYDPVLEGRYKRAVASSEQRETVLKAMATVQTSDGEVHTTTAYKQALEGGVDNPSQYVGQLVTSEYGSEIEKVRDRYYRFRDSLFTAYIRARPRLIVKTDTDSTAVPIAESPAIDV